MFLCGRNGVYLLNYDFKTFIQRKNMGSGKWEELCKLYPEPDKLHIPLSVADMELMNAPEIIEGLKSFMDHTILGYCGPNEAYFESVINWMSTKHGFAPKKEWFVETPGVVPALAQLVKAFTEPGDGVLNTPPVYYPFEGVVKYTGRELVKSQLIQNGDHYDIDFDDFEAKAKLPGTKLFIMCSPHNPLGRIWTRQELEQISRICLENGVYVISDEIHFDLIMPGHEHVSVGALDEQYVNNSVICTAPSKTFNLAGVQVSNIFIPDPEKHKKLQAARGYSSLNVFAYEACRLAYNKAGDWLSQLLIHLDSNRRRVEEFFARNVPQVKVTRLEATYLMWLDFRWMGLNDKELEKFMKEKAGWFTDEGCMFGDGGSGFERINIAMTAEVLDYMLDRLYKALKSENYI